MPVKKTEVAESGFGDGIHDAAEELDGPFDARRRRLPFGETGEKDNIALVHPAALSLPRMVSPQLVLRAHAGKGTLPPPAVWRELVAKASGRYGLDPRLIAAVIKVESNFETIAESEKGAQGLMQLMPGTQQMLGVIDPFDPEANVDAGSRYLRQQIDRFGRLDLALAAYNAGPGNVLRYGGIPPFAETQAYVSKVLSLLDADN